MALDSCLKPRSDPLLLLAFRHFCEHLLMRSDKKLNASAGCLCPIRRRQNCGDYLVSIVHDCLRAFRQA